MGLRTFDAPMTLDYRFGSFEAEEGDFRCFVREEDVEHTGGYLEIKGSIVFWVMLDYPGFDETMNQIEMIANKCKKTLGRHHSSTFILAVQNEAQEHKNRLTQTVESFRIAQHPGIYYSIEIWDDEGLQAAEQKYLNQTV